MGGVFRGSWWFLALALLSATAPACAPKRLAPVTAVPSVPPRAAGTAPAGQSPSGSVPGIAALDSLPAAWLEAMELAAQAAGPPAPEDSLGVSTPDAAAQAVGEKVAQLARTQVGKPYGWGGTGPERFDCSGLALYVYRQLGIALPRVSSAQASMGVHVDRSELKPGDLVFFSLRSAFDHVGIFLGNNRFVHAPRRQEPVRVDNLDDAWWNRAYKGARRVFGGQD